MVAPAFNFEDGSSFLKRHFDKQPPEKINSKIYVNQFLTFSTISKLD